MTVGWTEKVNTRKRAREKELDDDEEKRSSLEWKTERKREEKNDPEEARTPAICHSGLTVRGILDVSYLPLIAASVIQAEDKRGRNKIRTGSTGLPYSPLRRAPTSRGSATPVLPLDSSLSLSPALSEEKETISPTFLGSESTHVFPAL